MQGCHSPSPHGYMGLPSQGSGWGPIPSLGNQMFPLGLIKLCLYSNLYNISMRCPTPHRPPDPATLPPSCIKPVHTSFARVRHSVSQADLAAHAGSWSCCHSPMSAFSAARSTGCWRGAQTHGHLLCPPGRHWEAVPWVTPQLVCPPMQGPLPNSHLLQGRQHPGDPRRPDTGGGDR